MMMLEQHEGKIYQFMNSWLKRIHFTPLRKRIRFCINIPKTKIFRDSQDLSFSFKFQIIALVIL